MRLMVSVRQSVMSNHQKALLAVTHPCQPHTSMSLVVLSQTVPLSIPLPVMIPMTGSRFVMVAMLDMINLLTVISNSSSRCD